MPDSSSAVHPWRARDAVLAVLLAFNMAVAQPLLDVLGTHPQFLVAHDATSSDAIAIGLVLCVAAPLVLGALAGAVLRIHQTAGRVVLLLVLTGLWGLLAVRVLDGFRLPLLVSIVLAAVAGGAIAGAFVAWPPLRRWLPLGAIAPVAALVLFVAVSPASALFRTASPAQMPATEGAEGAHAPILLIVFDEFPLTSLLDADGELDAQAYPSLAKLARDGTFFTNATTVHPKTEFAVPAILTGKHPRAASLPLLTDHPVNLFTILGSAYGMEVREPITQLCPDEVCGTSQRPPLHRRLAAVAADLQVIAQHVLLPEAATKDLPAIDQAWRDFRADGTPAWQGVVAAFHAAAEVDRGPEFVEHATRLQPGDGPTLNFVHALLPHAPWDRLPSGQLYRSTVGAPGKPKDNVWIDDDWPVQQNYQRHLLQVEYVDRLIGEVIAHLERTGLYDETLIAVTADHGVSFVAGEHYRYFSDKTMGSTAWVPLFLKQPRQREGGVDDRPVATIDLVPSILDILGIDQERYGFDGTSLLRDIPPHRDRSPPDFPEWPEFDVAFRDAAVRNKSAAFATDGRRPAVYSLAPDEATRAFLGQPATPSGGAVGRVQLDDPAAYSNVKVTAPVLPAEISGTLRLDAPGGERVPLAIAINGRVQAVTLARPDPGSGDLRFSAIVPPSSLVEGENTIDSYVVLSDGLRPAPVDNMGTFSVTEAGDGMFVRLPGGRNVRVQGSAFGAVEEIEPGPNYTTLQGWAGDEARAQAADVVLLVAGGEVVASTVPQNHRVDLDPRHGLRRSGFKLFVSPDALGPDANATVVAVVGDKASRLAYDKTLPTVKYGLR